AFTGAATFSVPIATSDIRGFSPYFALRYSSHAANGVPGMGWLLSHPVVSRYTGNRTPRYDDDDLFIFGDVLVPLGAPVTQTLPNGAAYAVTRYARQAAQSLDRIERWSRLGDGDTTWRHIDRSGVTSIFGSRQASRISDPSDPGRVFSWLVETQYDTRGGA